MGNRHAITERRETEDLARMIHTRVRRLYRECEELRRLSGELLSRLDSTEEETHGDTSSETRPGRRAA